MVIALSEASSKLFVGRVFTKHSDKYQTRKLPRQVFQICPRLSITSLGNFLIAGHCIRTSLSGLLKADAENQTKRLQGDSSNSSKALHLSKACQIQSECQNIVDQPSLAASSWFFFDFHRAPSIRTGVSTVQLVVHHLADAVGNDRCAALHILPRHSQNHARLQFSEIYIPWFLSLVDIDTLPWNKGPA